MMPPFTWDAVTTNCRGGPESAVVYPVVQVLVEPAGFVHRCYTDPETGDEACQDEIVYMPPVFAGEIVKLEPSLPVEDIYTPGPGGVTMFEVLAEDEAGNRSGGTCL